MKDEKKYSKNDMVQTISKRLFQNTSGIILITTCYSIEKKYFKNNSVVKTHFKFYIKFGKGPPKFQIQKIQK